MLAPPSYLEATAGGDSDDDTKNLKRGNDSGDDDDDQGTCVNWDYRPKYLTLLATEEEQQ